MYKQLQPLLFRMDAEDAHRLTITALAKVPTALLRSLYPMRNQPQMKQHLMNRTFHNPVGLAAGFDKNGEALSGLMALGFGFVEAGTVTLKPQEGNPRPRIFRCPEHKAVINRMGFPNHGAASFKGNLEKFLAAKPRPNGVLGINIGMNKDQTNPARDYTALIRLLGPMADYLTINISSPNTPGLRNLQDKEPLTELLEAVMAERRLSCGSSNPPPLLVKLAPDLSEEQLTDIAAVLLEQKVDGVILTNTTLARPEFLPKAFAAEKGGLSGAPLKDKSTETIRAMYRLTGGQLPIIGAGGICNGMDAYAKIRAGASLIQVYSGLVYEGPSLIRRINDELGHCLIRDGFPSIEHAVGADHRTETDRAGEQHRVKTA